MRAIQYHTFGGPEVLRLEDVPVPEPGPHQVRVAVRAAGVNPIDWKIRQGQVGDQPMPQRPGLELAGVVDAAGSDASARPGEEVFGWASTGAYADYALAAVVATKPAGLSWTDAASLPVAGEAALRSLRLLDVHPGEVLLIHGGSGVVGATATQLAIARGVTVIATTDDTNADYVRSLGATPVRYGDGLVQRVRNVSERVDAVLDAAGFNALPDSLTLRGGTERIVTLADPAAFDMGITLSSSADHSTDVLADLADKVTSGQLRIRHARSYPLSEAAKAQQFSATGHPSGKITLETG